MQKKSWNWHFEKVDFFFLDRSSQSVSDGQGCGHGIFQIHKWIYKTTQEVRIILWNMFSFYRRENGDRRIMARYKVNSLSFKFWRIFGKCFSFYEKFFWKNALLVTLTRPEKLKKSFIWFWIFSIFWNEGIAWSFFEMFVKLFLFDFTISVFILVFYQHIFFSPWILTQVLNSIHRSPAPGLSNWLERSIYTFFFLISSSKVI